MLKFDDLVFGNSVNDFNRIDSGVKATSISPEEPSMSIFKVGIGTGTGGDFDPTKDIGIIDPDEPSTDDDDNETPAPSEPTSPSTPSTPKTGGGTETPVDNNAGDDKDKNTEDMPIVPEPANPSAPGSTGNSGGEDETAPADDDKKKDETTIPNEPATSGNNGTRKKTPIIENIAPEELDKKENIGNNVIVVESLKTHSKKLVDTDAQVAAMMFGGNTALQKGFMRESLVPENELVAKTDETTVVAPVYFKQTIFTTDKGFGEKFADHACFATSILNELSEEYTITTGKKLTEELAVKMMKNAIKEKGILDDDNYWAYVKYPGVAANAMWKAAGLEGYWNYERKDGEYIVTDKHAVYGVGHSFTDEIAHFVNTVESNGKNNTVSIFDVWDGNKKVVKNKKAGYDGREVKSTRLFRVGYDALPNRCIDYKRNTVYTQYL